MHGVLPALGGSGEEAPFGAEEVDVEVGEGALGQVREGGGELTGLGIGGDGADELDVGGEAVGGEEDAVAVAGLGREQVDEAGDRAGEGGAVECERADLGGFGALGFFWGAEPGFGVGAGALAVGGAGVDREAFGQLDGGGADLRGRGGFGALLLGDAEIDFEARRGCRWRSWSAGPRGWG